MKKLILIFFLTLSVSLNAQSFELINFFSDVSVPLPDSASGLSATGDIAKITLNWTDPVSNADSIYVYRDSLGTDPITLLSQVDFGEQTYVDSHVVTAGIWNYRIKAKNETGLSEFTAIASDTSNLINPLSWDTTNTVAVYDGEVALSDAAWEDQHTGGYDIPFVNTPTITVDATGDLDAVLLNGTNQSGRVDFTWALPKTIYTIIKPITWTDADIFYSSHAVAGAHQINQDGTAPEIVIRTGTASSNVDLDTLVYHIIVTNFNGVNSVLRLNGVEKWTGDAGLADESGFTLGAKAGGTQKYANIEVAFAILRENADDAATMRLFEEYLQSRSAVVLE